MTATLVIGRLYSPADVLTFTFRTRPSGPGKTSVILPMDHGIAVGHQNNIIYLQVSTFDLPLFPGYQGRKNVSAPTLPERVDNFLNKFNSLTLNPPVFKTLSMLSVNSRASCFVSQMSSIYVLYSRNSAAFGYFCFVLVGCFCQGYLCHGGCRLVPKGKNCLDIYVRISTDFHISPQEAVNVLVFHRDENPVIHFGNITHHCNLSLSES